jgi:hypothetical protein
MERREHRSRFQRLNPSRLDGFLLGRRESERANIPSSQLLQNMGDLLYTDVISQLACEELLCGPLRLCELCV